MSFDGKSESFSSTLSAASYDLQYLTKDYASEARRLSEVVAVHGNPESKSVLDVACGTGGHLQHLTDYFLEAAGLDLSGTQLAEAAKRLPPNVELHQGDMAAFELGRTFDVVACFFGSVGYLATKGDLEHGLSSMARHVGPGGLLVVEPWLFPHEFAVGGQLRRLDVTQDGSELIRRNVMHGPPQGEEGPVTIDMHFIYSRIENESCVVDSFREQHNLGLYAEETYRTAMEAAGVEVVDMLEAVEGLPALRPWLVGRMATAKATV